MPQDNLLKGRSPQTKEQVETEQSVESKVVVFTSQLAIFAPSCDTVVDVKNKIQNKEALFQTSGD